MTTTTGRGHTWERKSLAILAALALLASLITVFAPRAEADHEEYKPGEPQHNSADWWEDYLDDHDGTTNSECAKEDTESDSNFVADQDYRLVIVKKGDGAEANRLHWNVAEDAVLAPGPEQGDGQGYSHVIVCTNSPGYETTTTTEGTTTTTEGTTTTTQGTTTTTEGTTTTTEGTTTTTQPTEVLGSSIEVTKTAGVSSVEAPGENVTFTVVIANTGDVAVEITSLEDDVYGTLAGDADCQVGTVLAPGASCSFDFVGFVGGEDGDVHENTVTVNGEDPSNTPVNDDDDATVDVLGTTVLDVEVLPFTGAQSDLLFIVSMVLLGAGFSLIYFTRRRQEG
jgi:hypothetical protein